MPSEENPDILTDQGKSAYQIGDFQTAIHLFHEAERLYKHAGNNLMAAEVANNRSVALLMVGDARAALDAAIDTHLVFAESGERIKEGLALGNQAAALRDMGKKAESLKFYKLSAEKLSLAGDRENLALVNKSISALEIESGHTLSAMSIMLEALRMKENLTFREKILRKLFSLASRLMQ